MGFLPADDGSPASAHEGGEDGPFGDAATARAVVFVSLGATGADPDLDGLFRLSAERRGRDGVGSSYDRFCRPFAGRGADEGATQRMVREHGVRSSDLAGAAPPTELAAEFLDFLGPGPVVAARADVASVWLAWLAHAAGRRAPGVLGVDEARALFLPGRVEGDAAAPRTPAEVRGELAAVVGQFLSLPSDVRAFACAGWFAAWERALERDPPQARELAMWLMLAEHPSQWAHSAGELFAPHAALRDGALSSCASFDTRRSSATDRRQPPDPFASAFEGEASERAREVCEALEPRCAAVGREWEELETVPVDARGSDAQRDLALDDADMRRLDEVFEVHLPAAADDGAGDARANLTHRPGQHEIAHQVARTLGAREILLVAAPTGTGKTLAYLVPALLWSVRNRLRVGVSTYTRALQEQAARREVPRALAALARSGEPERARVTLLKGRSNYLCWRALRSQAPGDDDGPEAWFAWTWLVLFALIDEEGDLDRLPLRAPLFSRALARAQHGSVGARYQVALEGLVRASRGQTGCCREREDRQTCAADVARARAERSHVVLTNHAFALARQAFFKHVVFDECEHLHEQAHSAWSHLLSTREMRELSARLHQPGRGGSRALLDRLDRGLPLTIGARANLASCLEAHGALCAATARLERALARFKSWRDAARAERGGRGEHALLREYVERSSEIEGAGELLAARIELARALGALEGELAALSARLDELPVRGVSRLRRGAELVRAELTAQLAAVEAWIPLADGAARFRSETFHDLEVDGRGDDVLCARVLLPNEFLGRHYYPQLKSAVLISATTWLRGGFESSAAYLGLDRAAAPTPEEEREPTRVRTARAEEVFDYGRVLVAVPSDAPEVRAHEEWLAFVRRFVSHLGERTRGRMLVLFTNAEDARRTGEALAGFFRARHIPLWWQNMPGVAKEELPHLFRARTDSVLLGLDTFWFGADFPGETLEYLVLPRLPYGVPDRYHEAQCAALGTAEQRRRIYMPRALAKLRQGFGRLMRRESDRGCVYILDRRVLDPRHRAFLRELPLAAGALSADETWQPGGARLTVGSTDEVVHAGLAHMGMLADVRRRELNGGSRIEDHGEDVSNPYDAPPPSRALLDAAATERLEISPDDVPF